MRAAFAGVVMRADELTPRSVKSLTRLAMGRMWRCARKGKKKMLSWWVIMRGSRE